MPTQRRHSLSDVAARLGIDLNRDPDLWWLSERALLTAQEIGLAGSPAASRRAAAKQPQSAVITTLSSHRAPPAVEHAIACYSAIAREAGVGWPVRASDAEPCVGGGWWRGVARSGFDAEAPCELSFALGDILLVQQEDPATGCGLTDGWCMGLLESAPEKFGLVPREFVRLLDCCVTAAAPYDAVSSGEHSFEIGDEIIIRPGALPGRSWWLGSLNGRRGYFPRHVLDAQWAPLAHQHASRIQRRYKRWVRNAARRRALAAKELGERILACPEKEEMGSPAYEQPADANAVGGAAIGLVTAEAGTVTPASTAAEEPNVRGEQEALELVARSLARDMVAAAMSAALARETVEQRSSPEVETAPGAEMQAAPQAGKEAAKEAAPEADWREKVQADLTELQASLRAREEMHAARVQAELASLQAALQARFSQQEEAYAAQLQAVLSQMQASIPLGMTRAPPRPLSRDPSNGNVTTPPPPLHPAPELADPPPHSVSIAPPAAGSPCIGPLHSSSATLSVHGSQPIDPAAPAPIAAPFSSAGAPADPDPPAVTPGLADLGALLSGDPNNKHTRSSLDAWNNAALQKRSPAAESRMSASAPALRPVTVSGRKKSARRSKTPTRPKTPTRNAPAARPPSRSSSVERSSSCTDVGGGPAKPRSSSAQRMGRPDWSFSGVSDIPSWSSTRGSGDAYTAGTRTHSARGSAPAKQPSRPGSSQRPSRPGSSQGSSRPSSAQRASRTLSNTPSLPQLSAYGKDPTPAAKVGRLSRSASSASMASSKASTAPLRRPSTPSKHRAPPAARTTPKAPRSRLPEVPARPRDRARTPPPGPRHGHGTPRDKDLLWASPSDHQAIREVLQAANHAVGVHRAADIIRSQQAYPKSTPSAAVGAKPRSLRPGESIGGQQVSKPRRTYDRFYS
jgi:hypothetical protein